HRVFSPAVSPVAGSVLPGESTVINSCGSAAGQLCNFICNCSDCSDENQCGYMRGSAVLGTRFTCDFEDGDCGWHDVSTSTYRWVRGRASLAMWGTGPHSDHTIGTDLGWFMVTVSPPTKTTATAWLRSPVMREAAATCEIRAWYHLSGSGLNQTEKPVLRLAAAYRDEVVGLWQSPERGGEGWHQLVAYPGRITEQFQLIFSLTQPPAWEAELALDDIIFRNCGLQEPEQKACGAEESRCAQGSCLAQHRFCDGTDDCGDGSDENATLCNSFTQCSFEEDLCNWVAENGSLVWKRNSSLNLGTAYSLPTRDHTTNSRAGFFLHVGSASAPGAGSTALLSSPTFQATNSCSLVLYCHLHGAATSSISISYVINSTKHLVRERMGDLGSCWVRERVDFNVSESFKVLIEGVAGGEGTVAIDDLILSPDCKQEPKAPSAHLPSRARASRCAAEEVACDSGDCISAELACDFTRNCVDGSDEKHCGATTFEDGSGGWHDVSVGRLRWGVQRGTETTGSVLAGNFLALQAGEGQMMAAAKARTPLLGPSGPACAMQLSYRLHKLSCNFERGTCSWYPHQASDFKWVLSTGQEQGSDHTTGTGYFLSADPSAPWSRGQRAQLITHHQEPTTAPRCLSFWYRLAGPQIGTLNLKLQPEGAEETVLWTRRGTQGSIWHRGWATLPATGPQRDPAIFEAVGAGGDHGYIALDDLHVSDGACPEPGCPIPGGVQDQVGWGLGQPDPVGCLCTWQGRWSWVMFKVPSNPNYSVIPWRHTAVGTGTACLLHHSLATATGHPAPALGPRRGWWGRGWGCPPWIPHLPVGSVCLQHWAHHSTPFLAASCDFEQDLCGWSSSSDPRLHTFAWGWKNGTPLAKYPGPEQDHTLGTRHGHYVHFDTSMLGAGGTAARLESQPLPAAADSCLRFWYHMDIPEHLASGELRVMLHSAAGQRTVWSVAGHQSRGWQAGVVPVQSPSEFQIIFEISTWRWPMEGPVALDDIVYSTRGCHASPVVPGEEKSSGSFVAEVVLGVLLALVVVALVAVGSWHWLKRRGLAGGMLGESGAPQGFDNITFRD
ncbi:Apical endosomal glycoprotein, partial [Cuculus canorus]